MAYITQTNHSVNEQNPTAIAIPIPARIRNKKTKNIHLQVTKELLETYALSAEKYKEISTQKEPYDNGEVYVARDADFTGLNLNDPSTETQDIIDRIEKQSRLIVLLPIKTREDKEINSYVYLSSLRALANVIKDDVDLIEQFKNFHIPNFSGLIENLEKLNDIFSEVDINIFVCLGTNNDVII